MPQQTDWRFCQNCQVLFFDGFSTKGVCPKGGSHLAEGINFDLSYGFPEAATAQANWRFCSKCNAMFFDGFANKGACPAGGPHTAQGYNFTLPHDVAANGTAQAGWSYCNNALLSWQGLFSAQNGGGGEVYANRVQVGPWETWTLINNADGTVSLQSTDGHFLSALNGGGGSYCTVTPTVIGNSERFLMQTLPDGHIALRTHDRNTYLSVQPGK